ncbi:MAG: hypothetical protein NTX03_07230 [Bacteroidetes bacterium]|nr:hypothetical protein [Bacteroidota bacterium]
MKILKLISVAMLLTLAACNNEKKENATTETTKDTSVVTTPPTTEPTKGDKPNGRYSIERGVVEYEYKGVMNGTETMYFEDYGWKEAKYTNTTMQMGKQAITTSKMSLTEDDMIYNYDFGTKQGTKMKNPIFNALTPEQMKNAETVSNEMMKKLGGVKTGKETIAGKECDVWDVKKLGGKICTWQHIAMKTELNMGGMQVSILVKSIKEETPSADKMKLPNGVDKSTFKDVGQGNMGNR